ncbi:MAG: class I SAM-dependent methyltransferase [Chthoniobacterales bacterium]
MRDEIFQFAADAPDGGFKPEYFARLAAIEEAHFWFRVRNKLIQWALGNYFPDAKSFFEVGCGTGYVLAGIREMSPGTRLVGSDIFTDGLAFAKARLPGAELYQMDARSIPFEGEFDVVGAFDVLEHLVEDNMALAQMFNAARPGGGLLVTVPQQRYLWSASDEHAMHQRRYSRAELRRKVEGAGFQIERITSFNSLLFPLMVWSRMQQKRGQDLQRWRELEISQPLNKTLESILKLERLLIEKGVSFPVGGSLLLIGRTPLCPS